jgi:alpha-galactosidase
VYLDGVSGSPFFVRRSSEWSNEMKIVTIGAGSIVWGPTINADFLSNAELDGAELALMDINAETLDLVQRFLSRLIQEKGFKKTITATTDLEEALRDADYVLTAISVGGDRLWRYDAIFPRIYGVFQTVSDSIGPGGLMRAVRHTPALLQVAQTMQRVSKPGAKLLQLTNPMNPLCDALSRLEGISVYGICHGYDDTEILLSRQLGVPREDVRVELAGNNHNVYCLSLRVGENTYTPETIGQLAPQIFDTPFRAEVFKRYGMLVGNYSIHPIEYLPDFLTAEYGYGKAWGVSPYSEERNPSGFGRQEKARALLEQAISQPEAISWRTKRLYNGLGRTSDGLAEIGHSREIIDELIVALEYKRDFFMHLNVPNEGAIEGVAPEYNVEIPVTFRKGELVRPRISFPSEAVVREINRVGHEQHLIARACLANDTDLLIEALSYDALVPNKAIAKHLVEEMCAFQREFIAAS